MVMYSDDLARRICYEMAQGKTLADICEAPDMPNPQTVLAWRSTRPTFSAMFEKARQEQMHAWAEQIVSIIDNAIPDTITLSKYDSRITIIDEDDFTVTLRMNARHLSHATEQVKVRQWLMSRYLPQVFSERKIVHDGGALENLDEQDLKAELAEAMLKAGISVEELTSLIQQAAEKAEMVNGKVIEHEGADEGD